jgi:hypothetical protein
MTGTPPAARRSRCLALAALCAATLMIILDGTIVTVALPAIQRDLGAAAIALLAAFVVRQARAAVPLQVGAALGLTVLSTLATARAAAVLRPRAAPAPDPLRPGAAAAADPARSSRRPAIRGMVAGPQGSRPCPGS